MTKINHMDYKEYTKHLSIVILGILIAFWINNIGQSYKERATQKQVLITILNEVNNNDKSLIETQKNLNSLRELFSQIKKKDSLNTNVDIYYSGLNLSSIGYETAKYTGILKDIDYDLSSKIVENYEQQNTLYALDELLRNEIFGSLKNGLHGDKGINYLLTLITNLSYNMESIASDQLLLKKYLKAYIEQL